MGVRSGCFRTTESSPAPPSPAPTHLSYTENSPGFFTQSMKGRSLFVLSQPSHLIPGHQRWHRGAPGTIGVISTHQPLENKLILQFKLNSVDST